MFDKSINFVKILLTLILCTSLLYGCSKKQDDKVEEPAEIGFINLLEIPDEPFYSAIILDNGLMEKALASYEVNDDTLGWLHIPNTSLDDQVMYYPDPNDKFHYLRRDFYGNYSFAGTYFIDYRSKFDGGREGMSKNNVIYGHSMTDNPEDTLFSQLKKYKNPEFAEANPYIYFSTLEENMAWEVFAVFVTNVKFLYNNPNPDEETFESLLDEARRKSLHNYYDIEVTAEDKILTLSTCLYEVGGVKYAYPNNFRYVTMARMVPVGERLKSTANFWPNMAIEAP